MIVVHATNGLGDPNIGTALHSHGMFFNGTNYYDGAVGITQCSIPNNWTMDYHIDTSLQASVLLPIQREGSLTQDRPERTGFTGTTRVNTSMVFVPVSFSCGM